MAGSCQLHNPIRLHPCTHQGKAFHDASQKLIILIVRIVDIPGISMLFFPGSIVPVPLQYYLRSH